MKEQICIFQIYLINLKSNQILKDILNSQLELPISSKQLKRTKSNISAIVRTKPSNQ